MTRKLPYWVYVSGKPERFLFGAGWTGPGLGGSFSGQALCLWPFAFPFPSEHPGWNGTAVIWVFSMRLRNQRCPFGSTSVSAPRRDGLGEEIISSVRPVAQFQLLHRSESR